MTPEQLIKRHLLVEADLHATNGERIEITEENIDDMWEEAEGEDGSGMQDHLSEFRESGADTSLPSPHSRHYECIAVGRKLNDGAWVGWDYWYGGGKHGEPEAVDWMGGAYLLDVTEEEKLVTVRTFSKKEAHENA
jgi:hypothetical protein